MKNISMILFGQIIILLIIIKLQESIVLIIRKVNKALVCVDDPI